MSSATISAASSGARPFAHEMLVAVAKACIEPWTLEVKSWRTDPIKGWVLVLSGLSRFTNVMLSNSLFRDEIRQELIANFDGNASVDQFIVNPAMLFAPRGTLTWLSPHIRKLTFRTHSQFSPIRIDINAMTSLSEMHFDVMAAHQVNFYSTSEHPAQLIQLSTPNPESTAASRAHIRLLFHHSALLMNALVDMRVRTTLRTRCVHHLWREPIAMDFHVVGVGLHFDGHFVDPECLFLIGMQL